MSSKRGTASAMERGWGRTVDMAISHSPTKSQDSSQGRSTCRSCGHGNATARIVRTLFRRRQVVECGFMEEPVSGLAGAEVCFCRGAAHQVVLTHH